MDPNDSKKEYGKLTLGMVNETKKKRKRFLYIII